MKIGVIGLGKIAQTQYLPALVKHKNAEIIALCDQSYSLVEKIVEQYGFTHNTICCSINELVLKKPDLVFVLTHEHFDVALILINNRISICVEKPLCWNSKQAKILYDNAQRMNVKIYASYMKQYEQTFITLQNEIAKRGMPLAVNVSCFAGNNKRWCDPLFSIVKESVEEKKHTKEELKNSWESFFISNSIEGTEKKTESQLLLQLGIHQLNLIRKLFGHLEVQNAVSLHNDGVCTINTMMKGNGRAIVNYSLVPLFSGPWVWKEKYEIIYKNAMIVYHPGCPFLPISDAYLEIAEDDGNICNTTIKSGMVDSFNMMIDHILNCYINDEDDSSVLEAIEDIELIESMLFVGKNSLS